MNMRSRKLIRLRFFLRVRILYPCRYRHFPGGFALSLVCAEKTLYTEILQMILTTEKPAAGGDCIARHNGKIVFIPDSLPGEKLDVEITEEKRDYARAKILCVQEPSPHRTKPRCALYGICGGCNLQIADYPYQLELKKSIIGDVFKRAGFAPENDPQPGQKPVMPELAVIAGSPWEYRSRIQLHTGFSAQNGFVTGFMQRSSNTVVPAGDCPVAVPLLRAYMAKKAAAGEQKVCADLPPAGGIRAENRYNVCVCGNAGEPGPHVIASEYERAGSEEDIKSRAGGVASGDSDSANRVYMTLLGEKIYFDVRGFFQSNIPLFEEMIRRVCAPDEGSVRLADGRFSRALDLYSGCGVFAYFLRRNFSEVCLVEENPMSAGCARRNVPDAKIFAVSGKNWARHSAGKPVYRTVTADPPRSGLEKEVLERLCVMLPEEIRYISCNPVTLARDSVRLTGSGYRMTALYFFDFYPQTSHMEMLACFSHR
jgi:23S rRNA (uracil1939-C5)-methyltransferase